MNNLAIRPPHGFPMNTKTDGKGLWSKVARDVNIVRLEVAYVDHESKFASVNAYFDPNTWDIDDGIIYTDDTWLATFRRALIAQCYVPADVAAAISYSEMGMQGPDYVNLDCGAAFYHYLFGGSMLSHEDA